MTACKSNGALFGFEASMWAAAEALRNNMDAAEYKHVVVGVIFPVGASEQAAGLALRHQKHSSNHCRFLGVQRDAMQPKLMSGELRVGATERFHQRCG